MKLHLGVVDVAYSTKEGATTTGEVAEILEDNYHIMRIFYELNEQFISDALANQMAGAIESLSQGKPINVHKELVTKVNGRKLTGISFGGKIEERFRDFLDRDEISRIMPASLQIKAAQKGVNHRKKKPYAKKNKPRPSFIDTGLYQASFRSWVD